MVGFGLSDESLGLGVVLVLVPELLRHLTVSDYDSLLLWNCGLFPFDFLWCAELVFAAMLVLMTVVTILVTVTSVATL